MWFDSMLLVCFVIDVLEGAMKRFPAVAVVGMLSCASKVSALAVVPKVVVVRREWHP